MSSCLGLYIDNNVIKYAKVAKEHENFKIESFGIKFYDNIDETVKQIVNETYSYKTPISTNLSDEKYTSSELFSLLKQVYLDKAVKTEFEFFCNENKINYNATEYKHLLLPNLEDKDKKTCLYAYTEKTEIASKLQTLSGLKVNNISPLPISIVNLVNDANNKVIVNIENKTTLTFIINGNINRVETIDIGMKEIFDNITFKENSYAKAYEICKNSTIYTMEGKNLQVEENEYMEDIMPTLYKIVENVKDIINNSKLDIQDIYISGLAVAINNIDLYFQENFVDKKCEILAPFFVDKSNIKLNIRDYIEVNSAIALALQGLGVGYKEINFRHKGALNEIFNKEIGSKTKNKANTGKIQDKLKNIFATDFKKSLDVIEKGMIRSAVGLTTLLVLYAAFSNIIINQIKNKETEVEAFITDSNKKIEDITNNTRLVKERTEQYNSLLEKIREANDKIAENYAKKNAIPNFLTEIMYNIPKEVQLVSMRNVSGKMIKIEAQSKEYEQLGYFIAKIKNEGILTDVTATSGEKQNNFVFITIQGNLPY